MLRKKEKNNNNNSNTKRTKIVLDDNDASTYTYMFMNVHVLVNFYIQSGLKPAYHYRYICIFIWSIDVDRKSHPYISIHMKLLEHFKSTRIFLKWANFLSKNFTKKNCQIGQFLQIQFHKNKLTSKNKRTMQCIKWSDIKCFWKKYSLFFQSHYVCLTLFS